MEDKRAITSEKMGENTNIHRKMKIISTTYPFTDELTITTA